MVKSPSKRLIGLVASVSVFSLLPWAEYSDQGFRLTGKAKAALEGSFEVKGSFGGELRFFPEDPLFDDQEDATVSPSVFAEPVITYESQDRRHFFNFTPFGRWDNDDDNRTHADIRELSYTFSANRFDLRVGISQVNWGVAELVNPVDIINQTDLVDDPLGDAKLGQPMVNLTVPTDFGTVDLFVMTGFRERTFPADDARFRGPLPIDDDDAQYEDDDEEFAVDLAVRYANTIGPVDFGVSHFYGTNRDPILEVDLTPNGPELVPFYERINQTGLDLQALVGDAIFKGEAIYRDGDRDSFFAGVGGVEYTINGAAVVAGNDLDVGLIAEYAYDDRDEDGFAAPFLFQNDVLGAVRLTFNDLSDTSALVGLVVDLDSGVTGLSFEADRRVFNRFTVETEARFIVESDEEAVEENFKNDGFVGLAVKYNF